MSDVLDNVIKAHIEIIREKDAEIERLRGLLQETAFWPDEIKTLKQLITELADALVKDDQNYIWYNEGDDLIQRAREAAKDE